MKRYYTIFNILLITMAVYFSVKTFYKMTTAQFDDVQLTGNAFKTPSSAKNEPFRPLSDYDPIIARNLFNTKSGTGRQPESVDFENLQPTSLKLKLMGTVTGDKNKAFAVIQGEAGNDQQLYRTGDAIQNATLIMILREKIVLRVNNKDEILEIERTPGQQTQRLSKTSDTADSQKITLKRSQIETAVQNVNTLMQQARVRPHFTNGKPDGLSLTGIIPDSIFHDMGMKNEDIITGVNGKPVESIDDVFKFYGSLQAAQSVSLQFKRGGQLKTIDYSIE